MAVTQVATNTSSISMARALIIMSQAISAGTERYTDSRSHTDGYIITYELTRRDCAVESIEFDEEGPYFFAEDDDSSTCLVSLRFTLNCNPIIRQSLWTLVRRHCRVLANIEYASNQIQSDNMNEAEATVKWLETEIEDSDNLPNSIYFAWSASQC